MACVEHRADNICALKCTDAEALRIIGIQTNQQRDPADRSMEDGDSKVSRLGPVDLVFARVEFAELADQTIRPCQDRSIIEVRSIPFNKGTGDINTMLACFFQKKLRSPSVGDCFGYGVCLCTGIKGRAGCKKQLETGSTAQIDVSDLEAKKVTLPVSAVNDVLALEAKALSIKMADAAITLDKTAMQSVVEAANGAELQLNVGTGNELNEEQTAIIGDIEHGMVLDVSLTANGTKIHSFDGGVTVSVPFDWTKQGVLQAWYLADDGKKEPVEVAYRDGTAVLTLNHFSTYAIVVKANDPDSGIVSMGENAVTVQKQADAVYYAAALYAEDGRFLAYAASEAAEDEETVTLKRANADWSKAAKVKVFFLDADRKPVAEAVTALIKGESQEN